MSEQPGQLIHSHCWIDPTEPPIQRAPYSPVIGPLRREMKRGHIYVCRVCKAIVRPAGAGEAITRGKGG